MYNLFSFETEVAHRLCETERALAAAEQRALARAATRHTLRSRAASGIVAVLGSLAASRLAVLARGPGRGGRRDPRGNSPLSDMPTAA